MGLTHPESIFPYIQTFQRVDTEPQPGENLDRSGDTSCMVLVLELGLLSRGPILVRVDLGVHLRQRHTNMRRQIPQSIKCAEDQCAKM